MLQSRLGYSTWDLAHECEVSKRTIYRDLRLLTESGIPVCYDSRRRGYILRTCPSICTRGLSSDELTVLLLAAHICSLSCEHEISRPIRQAIDGLLSQAPVTVREETANLLRSVGGKPATTLWPPGLQSVVTEILTALRQKGQIRIVYHPSGKSAPPVQTKVTPHQLVTAQGHWYLVGRSSWHRRVHRFDLRSIRQADCLADSSEHPESPFHHA
jgi:predicted DNA-binding transcriptional regulator YafY